MNKRKIVGYGWRPDLPDQRDLLYSVSHPEVPKVIPSHIDLRSYCPPVYDQGQLGSCTANAIGAAFEFGLKKQKLTDFTPSRLFIYYNERSLEGTVNQDVGAQIRDGIKTVNKLGVCSESEWPYHATAFSHKPHPKCFTDALKNVAKSYMRVQRTIDDMKACLASGFPFVFGFSVYDSFEGTEVAKTGVLHLPAKDEQMVGGHAVMCVGYDDATRTFIIRNSWGTDWGQGGYFTMPYAYLTNRGLASDFWTIRLVN